jgi:peptide/nickel transport system substrate-binding protein
MRRREVLGGMLLAAGAGLTRPAQAQKSTDTLRIAWRDAIPNLDPYYNSLRTGLVLAQHAWDTLIYRDPETFQIKPQLAISWKNIDDTTIEFELRKGVVFHNGDPFSADDVAYTINTVLHDRQVAVPDNFSFMAGADKVDDTHVRIRLKRVFPAALEYLAMVVPIWPQAYREKVGSEAYAKAPVGTGPYRIIKVDGMTRIDLERNEHYFDGPKGKPPIRYLVINEVADSAAELSELLSGHADWIWMFNPDEFDTIARVPTLLALRAESMRIGYLSIDAAGRTGKDNPLTELKVRQAIFHAIDRQNMARQLVQGGSRALNAPCYPTQFGCDQAAAVKYDYDPAKAKQLLQEAGYPDGFSTELVSYVLPQLTGAVQTYLKAVGIDARVSQLQTGAAAQLATEGKAPLYLASWGSYSINDVSAILPYFFGGGDNDYARVPELEKLVQHGDSVTDPIQRRKAYSAAIRMITEQALWMPLFTFVTTYAFNRQLNFKPYADELPRFFLTSWK